MSDSDRKTVLTAAQPTGILTIGNYLGAIKQWGSLLDDHDCLFPLVDMHAITVPYVPSELRLRTRSLVAQYIACGLDPERCTLFIQSHVVGHADLAWVLGCLTPLGELQRMTQFKEKTAKGAPVNSGLLFYPVLMAADILLYNADLVPVGEDQKQHLELARNVAERFNHTYSETFKIPEPQIATTGARVLSLQDPTRKMSKSDDNQGAYILLTDDPDQIRKKIARSVTDSGSEVKSDPDKGGITNLLSIMAGFSGKSVEEHEMEFVGKGYGDFKKAVGEVVVEGLRPIRERFIEVVEDKTYLDSVLKAGAEVAQKKAYKILSKVQRKVGFVERFR
ncbi:MAG: tryptophan--tRNA ligase [Verrucomicrobia bacterium]|nr:tryptophan--tRNA ligase [Verrucomicrobiota bacterium]MDA1065399.1 tryptophan--tRNA ligase [Verrucomicrobiota bacterium]